MYILLEDFIADYLAKGFGSMNKNDFEVMIFHQLLQNRFIADSNYEISIALKIPESKVKRLRYEADLKYGNRTEAHYKSLFVEAIKKAKLKGDGNNVLFAVENVSLRKFLDSQLKKDGRFLDSSFNTEIINLYIDDYIYLLKVFYSEDEQKELIETAKQFEEIKNDSFDGIVREIINGYTGQIGSKLFDLSITGLGFFLKTLFV